MKEVDDMEVAVLKKDIRDSNHQRSEQQATAVYSQLTPQLKCQEDLAKKRGASSWLSVLPLSDKGFHLHKGEFRDALYIHYYAMDGPYQTHQGSATVVKKHFQPIIP